MLLIIAKRVISTLITLFGVTVVIFVILRLLPGNAIESAMGTNAGLLSHGQILQLDHYYGIGQSPFSQFFDWLGATLRGNLGVSLANRVSVASLIGSAFPVTLELAIMTMILGVLIGVLFGVIGALRPGRWGDAAGQGVALVGLGIPSFVLGTAAVTIMSSGFGYFPSSQTYAGLFSDPWLNLQQLFFPALVLSIGIGAAIMRTTRTAVLDVSTQNFIRTARGKGLRGQAVIWRHLFLNALVPVVTMSGIQLGYLLGGTVIIEQIFVLPGLGRLLVTSINNHDYPVVQSVTLLFAACFVVLNLLTDAICALIDPRQRDN
ncbi:MAG TPA: ABC transporter permease [Solirubrobacteraceae bacterium]|nr:ABC transporter permease [Solirubrobacteraceae bacterium]